MIDTVVLQLECEEEQINAHFFSVQEHKYPSKHVAISTVFSNVHKEHKKQRMYYPMILGRKRVVGGKEDGIKLEIQVSLPKLLHGTNVWEVTPDDLGSVYTALQRCLKQTGVELTAEAIRGAVLKRVDFSKIIRIPVIYGTAKQVTKKLSSFNYKQSSQFKYRDYGDFSDGAADKFYNNTQGYVIYDKIAELQGNGYTKQEVVIVGWYKEMQQRRDVLRFELSLERKQSMEAVLCRFVSNKKKNFTLGDIMANSTISKQIMLETFDGVFSKTYLPLVSLSEMAENQLETFLREQNLPVVEHSQLYYWVNMVDKIGLRATLDYMKERMPKTSFDRYKKKLSAITEKVGKIEGEIPSLVSFLRKKHEEFRLLSPTTDKDVVNHCQV